MTVIEWLRRLNLSRYAPNFSREQVYFVKDLRHFTEEKVLTETFKITEVADLQRLTAMMSADKKMKEDFQLLNKNKAR